MDGQSRYIYFGRGRTILICTLGRWTDNLDTYFWEETDNYDMYFGEGKDTFDMYVGGGGGRTISTRTFERGGGDEQP